jgi:hypothetical protein
MVRFDSFVFSIAECWSGGSSSSSSLLLFPKFLSTVTLVVSDLTQPVLVPMRLVLLTGKLSFYWLFWLFLLMVLLLMLLLLLLLLLLLPPVLKFWVPKDFVVCRNGWGQQ